jgi:RNA polymerase sigma factor (sigma-70 family)
MRAAARERRKRAEPLNGARGGESAPLAMALPPDPTFAPYPTTRHSLVAAAGAPDSAARDAAVDALIRLYWRPAYGRLRLKWRLQPADAEDRVQEFFAGLLDGEVFAGYEPGRSRFRTYLRTCLDRFAAKARRDEHRLKRGGGVSHLALDFAEAERDLGVTCAGDDPDCWFDREWVRALLSHAVDELREATRGTPRDIRLQVFECYDLHPADACARPGYREIAERFGIPLTQVTNHLVWSRRELRRLVLARLAEVTGSDPELREEAEELFGVAPGDVA